MKDPRQLIRAPLITEKGTFVSETAGQLVFMVDRRATKREVKDAVQQLFGVEVAAVRTINYLGKVSKRFGRRMGTKASWKKAYVTLKPGQELDLMENV